MGRTVDTAEERVVLIRSAWQGSHRNAKITREVHETDHTNLTGAFIQQYRLSGERGPAGFARPANATRGGNTAPRVGGNGSDNSRGIPAAPLSALTPLTKPEDIDLVGIQSALPAIILGQSAWKSLRM